MASCLRIFQLFLRPILEYGIALCLLSFKHLAQKLYYAPMGHKTGQIPFCILSFWLWKRINFLKPWNWNEHTRRMLQAAEFHSLRNRYKFALLNARQYHQKLLVLFTYTVSHSSLCFPEYGLPWRWIWHGLLSENFQVLLKTNFEIWISSMSFELAKVGEKAFCFSPPTHHIRRPKL
jgi:hypothetical protein